MTNLSQTQWIDHLKNDENAVIIDARTPDEWRDGIQENALLMNIMDLGSFQKEASQLDPKKNYYVYCRSGVRSIKACEVLESLGLDSTYNLLGGMLDWQGETVIPI